MNRRKVSAMIAAALISSQINSVALAETINSSNSQEIVSESRTSEVQSSERETEENKTIESSKEENIKKSSGSYTVTGKLELDINFVMPIKSNSADKTNIKAVLKDSNGQTIGEVSLGNDVSSGKVKDINYRLEALNSKRSLIKEGDSVSFYHLTFENVPVGTYSLEVMGEGYSNAVIENIEIKNTSKRILLGTTDNTVALNNVTEEYKGNFLTGDVNGDNAVDKADYEKVKEIIKSKSKDDKYDLNRDGKVDVTDLTYVHQNINKNKKEAVILDTDVIVDPSNASLNLESGTEIENNADIKDILKDNGNSVSLKSANDQPISRENPISFNINLNAHSKTSQKVEQIKIKAPEANAPTRGSIVIGGETFVFDESSIENSNTRNSETDIVINLGKQVAVSEIKINVTGSRSNKNLTEISKVEFLNNVYKEIPKPNMNVPVINNFTSTTQVGQESMTIGWNHESNVTGYEIKVQQLNSNNEVVKTSTYKTSENSLRIEEVEAYGIYRISIQSLSGDWKSGYKDEQEGYNASLSGNSNLLNNANDKDGKPDNVDSDYNPKAWDSATGNLEESAEGESGNSFGKDSIIEVQVIPETAPEGPEGITVKGGYRTLSVSWKSHKKAKDYDLYYRKVGTKEWKKANDPNNDFVDSNVEDDIPTGVADLRYDEKKDKNELIRNTSYTIRNLEDTTSYEIMMTATNHHGTGGLSKVYLGTTTKLTPPDLNCYKLINTPNDGTGLTNNIEKIEYSSGTKPNENAVADNDYTTVWEHDNWDGRYNGPVVTFNKEYTIGSIDVVRRLDVSELTHESNVEYYDEKTSSWKKVKTTFNETNDGKVVKIKLDEPVTTKKIKVGTSVYPHVSWGDYYGNSTISELKFYEYDSLEDEVDSLFADDLRLSLNKEKVTQKVLDDLTKRAKTIDPVNLEYHPNQTEILNNLSRAQDLFNDINLSDEILTLNPSIHNLSSQNIGQSNHYQSLGVAVRPGDKVTIYIGSDRKDTKFDLSLTQFNAESGTAYKVIKELKVGKNEIEIPHTGFDMNYEKGGNLYIGFKSNFAENNTFKVRVSGGNEIPHLNLNSIIDDKSKEAEAKESIRTYIRDLKKYVNDLPKKYPEKADKEDNANNIYTYDPETSILNAAEIEGKRITLSLAADQMLKGIEDGLGKDENAEVDRLYNTLLAWEQLMKVSYSQQGLIEESIDFDGDGQITDKQLDKLNGYSEKQYFNMNRAPKNRINIKYQRMFTGAFMYASSHHVGIGYGSIAGMMQGVPFEIDDNGNLLNSSEGRLFGWGISHEIGHVHDRPGLTYAETTNNILALITQTFNDVNNSRLEDSEEGYKNVYEKVTSNSEGLASDGLTKLGMFWQLHLAYDNDYTYSMLEKNADNTLDNDTFYAKLYRETRIKGTAQNESGYDSTAQTFIMRSSDAVKKDLRGFFAKWGLIASPNTNAYLNQQNYQEEDKAIYYLNDEARRMRLKAGNDKTSLTMAEDTKVKADFGCDKNGNQIKDRSYLNQKEVPLTLSVDKDSDKILGYEIIRKESTSSGVREEVVGFAQRDKDNSLTTYVDEIDTVNNRTFEYKVKAYDYDLNVTEETTIGTVKVNHDGSISKGGWNFDTNTRSHEDHADENSGHGQVQNGSIKKINDNDPSTVYTAAKATDSNGNVVSGDPYVTIDLNSTKSVIGLKYNPGKSHSKFSLKNIFGRKTETSHSPITKYEVLVSKDGKSWTRAHSGTFNKDTENTIYFNELGNNVNTQLWAYEAQYVKLVAKGASAISIAELDILGPAGDNIEIGFDNGDKVFENGIGRLKSDYTYAEGKTIPKDSIIVTGKYKGDPAFNVPLILNENGDNFALNASAVLLAEIPEGSQLGEVAEGSWIYWITPDQQKEQGNIEGSSIKAELYRYNKLNESGSPVGQRLVSDTFLYDLPDNLDNLPEIEFNNSKVKSVSSKIVEINNDVMDKVFKNRR